MHIPEHMTPDEFRASLVKLGLSQREIADQLGLDVTTINRWATGKTTIPRWVERHLEMLVAEQAVHLLRSPESVTYDEGTAAAKRGSSLANQVLDVMLGAADDGEVDEDNLRYQVAEGLFELARDPRKDRAIPAFVSELLPVLRAGSAFDCAEGISSDAKSLYKHPDGLGHIIYDPRDRRLYLVDESNGPAAFASIGPWGLRDMAACLIDVADEMEKQDTE